MRIEFGVVSTLENDAAVSAVVSDRIYFEQMPQNTIYPCITYQRVSTTRREFLDGVDTLTDVRIQVDAWGTSPVTVKDLADKVRAALEVVNSDLGDVPVKFGRLEGENDLSEFDGDDEVRRVNMSFVFTYHE